MVTWTLLLLLFTKIEAQSSLKEFWFEQTIDHFNFRPQGTFKQRYYVDDSAWEKNGPILFYTGNEAAIDVFIQNTGVMWEIAPAVKGLIVFAEHRYYGQSIPFGSQGLDPEHISFLTVEQAMADFAELVVYLKQNSKWSGDAPVISFGGSYGANLAMWMRTKYPNLIAGAIASSATPLKHLLRETNAFWKIVTDVYSNVSVECSSLIRDGFKQMMQQGTTQPGRNHIGSVLGLCSSPSSLDDIWTVYDWLMNGIETMVQYGYPYPTSFYNPVPAYPFAVTCQLMQKDPTPLGALRAALNVYYNWTGEAGKCFNFLSLDKPATRLQYTDTSAWGYQTCTEVYQPMPTNGVTDMFLPYIINNTAIYLECNSTWSVFPRANWEEMNFWGADIRTASNIFLTSGQLDPWRAAGITKCPRCHPSIIIRVLEDAAHHLDLRPSNKLDPPSVKRVRVEQVDAIKQWMSDWHGFELDSFQ